MVVVVVMTVMVVVVVMMRTVMVMVVLLVMMVIMIVMNFDQTSLLVSACFEDLKLKKVLHWCYEKHDIADLAHVVFL